MKNDNALVDINVFLKLFKNNYFKVKRFAYGLLKSELDAEDVAQEVFAKLWEQSDIWLNNERELDSYILVMARNIALNISKHQQIKLEYQDWFIKEEALYSLADDYFLEKIYCSEMLRFIQSVLTTLPERRKIIFELSRFHGESNKEIADKLNISVRTVERQVYLTLTELRKVLASLS